MKNAELFDDAEQIIPAETKTQNIGIIGFPKKPKSDGEDSFYTIKSGCYLKWQKLFII